MERLAYDMGYGPEPGLPKRSDWWHRGAEMSDQHEIAHGRAGQMTSEAELSSWRLEGLSHGGYDFSA